jgi:hypothetical protein
MEVQPMQSPLGIIAIAAITAVGWIAFQHQPLPRAGEPFAAAIATYPSTVGDPSARSNELRGEALQPEAAAIAQPTDSDPGLIQFVNWKYSYLVADRNVLERDALDRALLLREQLAVAINTSAQAPDAAAKARLPNLNSQMLAADERVRQLLHPESYAEYLLLKDADAELHRIKEYAGGISNVAPLLPEQERAILFAKLTYKQHYDQLLRDSGLQGTDLAAPQRLDAYRSLARSLNTYRNDFLLQARQSLHSEAQYLLLQNYENTEFEAQLAELHAAAVGE